MYDRTEYQRIYRKRRRASGLVHVHAEVHESNRERALKYLNKLQKPAKTEESEK
jgi:hypothetical protein